MSSHISLGWEHGIHPKWFEGSLSVKPTTPFIKHCKKISVVCLLTLFEIFFLMERFIYLRSHIHQDFFFFSFVFSSAAFMPRKASGPQDQILFTHVSLQFFHGCNFTFNSLLRLAFLLLYDVQDGFWWYLRLSSLLFCFEFICLFSYHCHSDSTIVTSLYDFRCEGKTSFFFTIASEFAWLFVPV